MSTADIAAPFEQRREPALAGSIALSLGMHALLVAILLLGVSWQSREPEPVVVELWRPPPAPVVAPVVESPPPVQPAPAPEPRVEKPDIALPVPKPKPKPEPRIERKVEPKAEKLPPKPVPQKPAAPVRDLAFERRLKEQLATEQASITAQRQEDEMRQLLERQQAEGRSKALATWTDKIRAKIKGNILLPQDISGNPEAIFDVVQLPSGEVLGVKLRKSSGHPGYDEAVERAILKSSPLPKPDEARLFQRQLELKFRPLDK